jgi:hypothetical protein
MSHQLDYRTAKLTPGQDDEPEHKPRGPRSVIPIEFDTVVTKTKDQGGAGAVEQQLQRENIPVHRTHEGPFIDQTIELLVRAQDADRAMKVATAVFARRQKLKSFPR